MHEGVDYNATDQATYVDEETGEDRPIAQDPILATAPGEVVYTGWDDDYGNYVILEHQWLTTDENGNNIIETIYTLSAHLDSITVSVGQTIARGESIGIMGQTGNSSGKTTHLHLEFLPADRINSSGGLISSGLGSAAEADQEAVLYDKYYNPEDFIEQ